MYSHTHTHQTRHARDYGVATISRHLKTLGLFCKRALLKRQSSAKETYNCKEPANRSHPIITPGNNHRYKVQMCVRVYIYIYIYTLSHTRIYIYIYIYVYI